MSFTYLFVCRSPRNVTSVVEDFENWDKKEEHRKNTHGLDMESAYMLPDNA